MLRAHPSRNKSWCGEKLKYQKPDPAQSPPAEGQSEPVCWEGAYVCPPCTGGRRGSQPLVLDCHQASLQPSLYGFAAEAPPPGRIVSPLSKESWPNWLLDEEP